jgi:site-specific recombinase XerC
MRPTVAHVPTHLSPTSCRLCRELRHFLASHIARGADAALCAVSVAEARAFVVSLQEAGLSPSSVAGFVRGLRAFAAWCAAEGLVADEVKRQHAQASPVDRLAIGPKVTILLPSRVADRLKAIASWERTSVEEMVRRGADELVARRDELCLPRDTGSGLSSAA